MPPAVRTLPRERASADRRVTYESAPTTHHIRDAVREAAVRATIAIGLGGIAVIHAVDGVGKWSEVRYLFWMYMALIVASIVTAAGVLFSHSPRWLLAAGAVAASVFAGYVVNRTVGLPDATGDIGNWTEPLGLASLIVEAFVIAVAAGGLRTGGSRV